MYDFLREMHFDEKCLGNKSTRDKSRIKLPKRAAIMTSEIFTKILPENAKELCDRLKFLTQKKQSGSSSDKNNGDINAIADKK